MQGILFWVILGFSLFGCTAAIIAAVFAVRSARRQQDQMGALLTELKKNLAGELRYFDGQFHQQAQQNDQNLDLLRRTLNSQLTEMRQTVDVKLDNRLDRSFSQVSTQLEQVYRGLGEMQGLAANVGDLKKILANVKTRGTLGEVQLEHILQDILPPSQYEKNIATKHGSRNVVEFAVKMPGGDAGPVYLPIDAKFPADAYVRVVDALEEGSAEEIAAANHQLSQRVRGFARDIRDKYIDPPHTTDFAILFLPFEGLYAQVLQLGLMETLHREYKITLAGPTTMAALLNSLQMGFQTLAIQQRSSEVWNVLGAVKTEFNRFEAALNGTQQKLEQAGTELEQLVGTRTRMMQRRLARISAAEPDEAAVVLEDTEDKNRNVD